MKTFISEESLQKRIEANQEGGDGLEAQAPQSIDPNAERKRLAALQLGNLTTSANKTERFYFAE